jgi:hypothetical protein
LTERSKEYELKESDRKVAVKGVRLGDITDLRPKLARGAAKETNLSFVGVDEP